MIYQSHTELEAAADELTKKVESLTNTLRSLHEQIQWNRMDAGRRVKRLSWDPGSDYDELKRIRKEASAKQLEIVNLKKVLAEAKCSLCAINKMLPLPIHCY